MHCNKRQEKNYQDLKVISSQDINAKQLTGETFDVVTTFSANELFAGHLSYPGSSSSKFRL
jgi:hypothetical protein